MALEGEEDFDMDLYLMYATKDHHIDKNEPPNYELLKKLVWCHVSSVHYQNYHLLTRKEVVSMKPAILLKRLLVEGQGGMCYETSELMFHVLSEFKFDVRRVNVFVLSGSPYDPSQLSDHNVLVVFLDGKKYLIDVGFGYNSLREPVQFTFEDTEEKEVAPGEKYRLSCGSDHFQLDFWLKNDWASFYRFDRPLHFIDERSSLEYYRNLVLYPGVSVIRDSALFVGILFEGGRFGFSCDYDQTSGATNFNFLTVADGVVEKKVLAIDEFVKEIQKHLKLAINYVVEDNYVIKFL